MILAFDSSSPIVHLTFIESNRRTQVSYEAGRELARGLLSFLRAELAGHQMTLADITGIAVFRGPGSFTGLRIGMTVLNTLASSQEIPIVGMTGDDWVDRALERLRNGDDDRIVLPEYGGDAHITTPRK